MDKDKNFEVDMDDCKVNETTTLEHEEDIEYVSKAENLSAWAWIKAILFQAVIPGALTVFILFKVIFCLAIVEGYSMYPTYNNGDFVIANHITCYPDYGDVVIIKNTSRGTIIKRVIGLPGDVIEVDGRNGVVYRNGEAVNEPYVKATNYGNGDLEGPVTIADGHVFVMGDNRQDSYDSRYDGMGQIPEENVYAEVLFRIMKGDSK